MIEARGGRIEVNEHICVGLEDIRSSNLHRMVIKAFFLCLPLFQGVRSMQCEGQQMEEAEL